MRRIECPGGLDGVELDLDDTQSRQIAVEDVDIGHHVELGVERHAVAALFDATSGGVRPQLLGVVGIDCHVHLGAGETATALDRERGFLVSEAYAHGDVAVLGEVALANRHTSTELSGTGCFDGDELSLDFHSHETQYGVGAGHDAAPRVPLATLEGGITTYRGGRNCPDANVVAAALEGQGFTLEGPRRIQRTVIDTFDGRLFAAGLRLELTTPAGVRRAAAGELVLRGSGGAAARVGVAGRPQWATDVPAGPLRVRLARLLAGRALRPFVVVETERTVATKCSATGKTTSVAVVHARPVVDDVTLGSCLVEAVELVGYVKPAAQLRDALGGLGMTEIDGDLADVAAGAAAVDLAGQSVVPGIPLAAHTPANDAFRAVLANLRRAIVVNWDDTIADTDPEFLHDLRVAVRRTRSVLANAKNVFPSDIRDRVRGEFGWLGQITSPARDLDVYQIEWPTYTDQLAASAAGALEALREHLEMERQAAHARLADELSSPPARRIIDAWGTWLDAPLGETEMARDSARPIAALIDTRIRRAHRAMIKRGRTITPDTSADVLHELRKDAKKLRYLLECFGGLYQPAPRKAFVQRLKSLQDNLGEHQDAEVHVHHLRQLFDTLAMSSTTDTVLATGQLIERMEQRRLASRNEFAERFSAFDSAKTDDALNSLLASTSDSAGR